MDKLPIQWESEMQKKNTLGKFLCSEQETTEHSPVQPIIKMKGKFPSNLPSSGMVNIPSWLPWPDSSNTTHFFEGRKRGWGVKYTFYSRKCFIGWAISVSTIFNSVKRKYFWIAHFLQELKHKAVCLQSPACSRSSLVLLLPMLVKGQPSCHSTWTSGISESLWSSQRIIGQVFISQAGEENKWPLATYPTF